jgi:hypothetical protein
MEASVNHRAANSPTWRRHCASTSASRVIIAPGHSKENLMLDFRYFRYFPAINKESLDTLLAKSNSDFLLHAGRCREHVKF